MPRYERKNYAAMNKALKGLMRYIQYLKSYIEQIRQKSSVVHPYPDWVRIHWSPWIRIQEGKNKVMDVLLQLGHHLWRP